jgi:hypothetical protein
MSVSTFAMGSVDEGVDFAMEVLSRDNGKCSHMVVLCNLA